MQLAGSGSGIILKFRGRPTEKIHGTWDTPIGGSDARALHVRIFRNMSRRLFSVGRRNEADLGGKHL